ncbi:probable xyloglucan galactosyltransferase GT17 [Cannabis sativa]|uniref:Exostosin GT47 domain-containing protein n=1 Tax=Cannabis sativa TaxID=3483 RepID=A0A803PE34_CANSA|nr:probable xyloglucan galactosyltransferase GT17 [Cannabis sativa]
MFFRKQSPPASWTAEKKKNCYDNSKISKDQSPSVTFFITNTLNNNPRLKYIVFVILFLLAWFLLLSFRFPLTKNDNKILHPVEILTKNDNRFLRKQAELPWVQTCQNGNLSIYVYDLPPEFNIALLQRCRKLNVYTDMCPHVANRGLGRPITPLGSSSAPSTSTRPSWYATHQFIAEMIFHARVENHACRTWDPERATIFYVPFYGGLDASSKFRETNLTERDALSVQLVDFLQEKPWWKRNHGKDHFLALGRTAWDFMRNTKGNDFGANCLLNLPAVKNMTVLTVERQPWQGSNQHGIPYPSYFHPSTWQEVLTWQEKVRNSKRPHLFSFIGGPRKGLEKAAIRDELITQCAGSTRCELLKCGSKCHDPAHVIGVMSRSVFCLQAPGDSFTRRSTFDSVLAGCIPVFFSQHTAYSQYRWFLPEDTSEYSVFFDEKSEDSRRIEEELAKIPGERVERMREKVIGLIPRLTYTHPNATGTGFEDAVDVALAALANHVQFKLA